MTPSRHPICPDCGKPCYVNQSVRKDRAQREEIKRLRRLVRIARDGLDAEKTPDFGVGHDRAVAALSEALQGVKPRDPYAGAREVPLDELR